jgi:hypothetical protein
MIPTAVERVEVLDLRSAEGLADEVGERLRGPIRAVLVADAVRLREVRDRDRGVVRHASPRSRAGGAGATGGCVIR